MLEPEPPSLLAPTPYILRQAGLRMQREGGVGSGGAGNRHAAITHARWAPGAPAADPRSTPKPRGRLSPSRCVETMGVAIFLPSHSFASLGVGASLYCVALPQSNEEGPDSFFH